MAASYVDVPQFENLRPLGALEQFSSARHHLGFFNNVAITATYTYTSLSSQSTSTTTPFSLKDTIFTALSSVLQQHSVLTAIPINEDSTTPHFIRLPTLDLETAVTFITSSHPSQSHSRDEELSSILSTHHTTPFQATQIHNALPFWRLLILTQPLENEAFTAIFVYHHSLGDGLSGINFHKAFFSFLNSPPTMPTKNTIITSPSTPLLPNLELLHPLLIPAPSPNLAGTPANIWTGSKITTPMRRSNFKLLTLSKATTTSLLRIAKRNKTTLTALIPPLISTSLFSILPSRFENLECTIPVSLRRWLPPPVSEAEIGVFIDAFSVYFSRSDSNADTLTTRNGDKSGFTWDEARRSKECIDEYLRSGGERINVAKFKHIPDMRKYFLDRVGEERKSSFEVSNLGVVKVASNDGVGNRGWGWEMGRMVFSRSAFVAGSAISTSVIMGPDGCLVMGFSWQEEVVSKELVESVIVEVGELVDAVVVESL